MSEEKRFPRNPAALSAYLAGDEKNYAIAQMPGGIEAQEAVEQQKLIESQKLPKEGTIQPGYSQPSYQAQLEALGFVFGAEIDELFVACQLPKGWVLEPTEHSMWSRVKDDLGRTRLMIFYKGAFYDRRAHASVTRRFTVIQWNAASPDMPESLIDYSTDAWKSKPTCVYVKDWDGSAAFHSAAFGKGDRAAEIAANQACDEWVGQQYPDYKNPFAYWD